MKKHEGITIQTTALQKRRVYKYIAFCMRSPLMHPAWIVLDTRMHWMCTSLQFRVLCGNHKYTVFHVFALCYPVIPSWLHACWEYIEKMGITMNRILVAISMMVGEHWLTRLPDRCGGRGCGGRQQRPNEWQKHNYSIFCVFHLSKVNYLWIQLNP